ncbi:MAG: response regulator transcription factor [Firmicutes bacterium]|jgi:DNA-binding LytR/AlgR family response regulator|nr:response regulator transcription factor [Bacillota bacterium]
MLNDRPVKLRAVLVDDEEPARRELRYLLTATDRVEVVAEADSGQRAINLTRKLNPDVLFLDVRMPPPDGFAVARQIINDMDPVPFFVFATAYDQYALEAFEVSAVDYLLKPFQEERVLQTVERLLDRSKGRGQEEFAASLRSLLAKVRDECEARVPVEHGGRIILLPVREIVFATCHEGDTVLKAGGEEYQVRSSLLELEERLGHRFLRVHKGYVVNLDRIAEVIPWFHGSYLLIMGDENRTEIPVSRRLAQSLKERLGLTL